MGKRKDEDEGQRIHQLLDIIAEEISDVDRAANRRRYLVVKRRTDMGTSKNNLGPEVVSDDDGNLTTVQKTESQSRSDGGSDADASTTPEKDGKKKDETQQTKQATVIPAEAKKGLLKTTTEALERLMSLVKMIKDAEETDEKLDKPTPDSVARELRAISELLTKALERYPAPVAKDQGGDASTDVAKAGARLAGKRRDQLKSVIDLLQKLLEEVMPQKTAPRGAQPGDRNTDPNRANVGAGVQPDANAARSAQDVLSDVPGLADVLKSISEGIAELKSKAQGQDEEIARLRKSTGLPASREVDSVNKPKPPETVSWPLDMNRPLSRDQVAKEVSFFDDQ